jgi:transposase
MAYAPTHEKELLDQSDRRRMGMHHKPHVPPPNKRGRPRLHTTREILDAVFYVLKSGCAWRLLPYEFPPWETVYHYYFRRWRIDGTPGRGLTRRFGSGCEPAWG